MTRLLATLALIVSQSMSWAAGPLYVCVDREGEVCLDRGPQACDCCATDIDLSAASHADHDAATCTGMRGPATLADASLTEAPCDCDHQLLEAAPTTGAARSLAAGMERPDQAPLWSPAVVECSSATNADACWAAANLPAGDFAQHLVCCVVLRC